MSESPFHPWPPDKRGGSQWGTEDRRVIRARLLKDSRPEGVTVGVVAACPDCDRLTAFVLDDTPWCELCWWRRTPSFQQVLDRAMGGAKGDDDDG